MNVPLSTLMIWPKSNSSKFKCSYIICELQFYKKYISLLEFWRPTILQVKLGGDVLFHCELALVILDLKSNVTEGRCVRHTTFESCKYYFHHNMQRSLFLSIIHVKRTDIQFRLLYAIEREDRMHILFISSCHNMHIFCKRLC